MTVLHYLAYGSNLHPLRLEARIPARLLGAVRLRHWRLRFHKVGADGSGKCDLVAEPGACAYGAVYAIEAGHKPRLDAVEGEGYATRELEVELDGRRLAAFAYVARPGWIDPGAVPHRWYRQLVLWGALHHRFPARYVEAIAGIPARQDAALSRRRRHQALLARMRALYLHRD